MYTFASPLGFLDPRLVTLLFAEGAPSIIWPFAKQFRLICPGGHMYNTVISRLRWKEKSILHYWRLTVCPLHRKRTEFFSGRSRCLGPGLLKWWMPKRHLKWHLRWLLVNCVRTERDSSSAETVVSTFGCWNDGCPEGIWDGMKYSFCITGRLLLVHCIGTERGSSSAEALDLIRGF